MIHPIFRESSENFMLTYYKYLLFYFRNGKKKGYPKISGDIETADRYWKEDKEARYEPQNESY